MVHYSLIGHLWISASHARSGLRAGRFFFFFFFFFFFWGGGGGGGGGGEKREYRGQESRPGLTPSG